MIQRYFFSSFQKMCWKLKIMLTILTLRSVNNLSGMAIDYPILQLILSSVVTENEAFLSQRNMLLQNCTLINESTIYLL